MCVCVCVCVCEGRRSKSQVDRFKLPLGVAGRSTLGMNIHNSQSSESRSPKNVACARAPSRRGQAHAAVEGDLRHEVRKEDAGAKCSRPSWTRTKEEATAVGTRLGGSCSPEPHQDRERFLTPGRCGRAALHARDASAYRYVYARTHMAA